MTLNGIERDFLNRLSLQAWTSPPLFDHRLLDRLAEARYITRQSAALDAVHYEITNTGRAAVVAEHSDPTKINRQKPVVYFGSFQDLLGRDAAGNIKP
jgi:hypothetical protein